MQKTYYPKKESLTHNWVLVDASGQNLGRLAAKIARVILGKNKPEFTPGANVGDFVVVVNAEKIQVTGTKLVEKMYYRHSGYPGGLTTTSLQLMLDTHPERVIRRAVWGMLPHNKARREMIKRLKVYAGASHPHEAQNPQPLG